MHKITVKELLLHLLVAFAWLQSSTTASTQAKCGAGCVDVDPAGNYTCAQQAAWGKCDESWMSTCQCSCNLCEPQESDSSDDGVTFKSEVIRENEISQPLTKMPLTEEEQGFIDNADVKLTNLLESLLQNTTSENGDSEQKQEPQNTPKESPKKPKKENQKIGSPAPEKDSVEQVVAAKEDVFQVDVQFELNENVTEEVKDNKRTKDRKGQQSPAKQVEEPEIEGKAKEASSENEFLVQISINTSDTTTPQQLTTTQLPAVEDKQVLPESPVNDTEAEDVLETVTPPKIQPKLISILDETAQDESASVEPIPTPKSTPTPTPESTPQSTPTPTPDLTPAPIPPQTSAFKDLQNDDLISLGDFVQRSGTRFVVKSRSNPEDCETFYFVGWNTYYPMLKAAEASTRHEIIEILDDAVEMGLTVMRVWGFSDGPLQWQGAQRYPGVYDEATLVGMDFTLHEASKRGIRLVIAFANYWQHYGGIDQYNVWSYQAGYGSCNGEYACRDDFFSDPVATQFYKDHIYTLLNRKNTFNGRVYKEDPAIFGYNLMNEPRSKADLYVISRESTDPTIGIYNITYNDGSTLQTWIEDVAKYIKQIDPVHLLTTGQEGFFGESAPLYLYANPGAWAALEGNDFVRNHQVEGIDYATMHVYVDQWLCDLRGSTREGQMDFFKEWVEAHQEAAEEELQMPVVLEEFGGKLEDNNRFDMYKFAFDSQLASAKRGGSFGGVMFWILYHSDYEPLDHYGGGYGMYLPASSEEMKNVQNLVVAHSNALNAINVDSSSSGTCVWYPDWPQGLGCRYVDIAFQLGGMPWECLPGEPENINWCNARGRQDLYKNPPEEWKGRTDGADLPFNTIESLVMGVIRNTANHTINLRDSYIIIPFSRGIHTIFEGVWERVKEPNKRFSVMCWYIAMYEAEGYTKRGTNFCNNSTYGVTFEFTEINWPQDYDQKETVDYDLISMAILL